MQLRSIIFSALFVIAFGLPAFAQSERAALIDFNSGDKRSDGTVVWRTEQVKTSDGRDDLAIRADVEIPGRNLKLTMLLRRNLDPSVPASHLIELHAPAHVRGNLETPSLFIDKGVIFEGACKMEQTKGGSVSKSTPAGSDSREAPRVATPTSPATTPASATLPKS